METPPPPPLGGVDRSALTMLGGPYIHTSVCCKLCGVYGRAATAEQATDRLIAACLSVMRRVTQNLHGMRLGPFNHTLPRGEWRVSFRVANPVYGVSAAFRIVSPSPLASPRNRDEFSRLARDYRDSLDRQRRPLQRELAAPADA